MIKRASNLTQRIASALLLAPPVVACLNAGGVWVMLLVAAATLLLLLEWHALTDAPSLTLPYLLLPAALALLLACLGHGALAIITVMLAMALRLLSYRHFSLWPALGLGYIMAGSFGLLAVNAHGGPWLLWLFATIWATDIGGYVFGKSVGGKKLAPTISPGKTWAGLGGCAFFAGLVGIVTALILEQATFPWMAGGMVLAVIAQMGDLFESAIKRRFGKKDSGALIPGHGGLLDRVDGLLVAAPVLAIFLYYSR